MRGMEIAKRFFEQFGLPAMEEHFPGLKDRAGAGLIGRGSEVLGADDEHSRDHGWGPRFCLVLTESDFEKTGKQVEEKLNAVKPREFEGLDLAEPQTHPITVTTVDLIYRDLTGSAFPPSSLAEWASADENGLCFAQAGKVFHDPTGSLTERKRAFEQSYYPEPIWKWRIASKAHRLWDYGDYNTSGRLRERNDGPASLVGQGYFVEAAMQLAFLLNRRFAPYWKWLHWGFQQLPTIAEKVEPLLTDLGSSGDLPSRAAIISHVCQVYREVLHERGIFPDRAWRNFMGSFEILDSIQDPEAVQLIRNHYDRHRKP